MPIVPITKKDYNNKYWRQKNKIKNDIKTLMDIVCLKVFNDKFMLNDSGMRYENVLFENGSVDIVNYATKEKCTTEIIRMVVDELNLIKNLDRIKNYYRANGTGQDIIINFSDT